MAIKPGDLVQPTGNPFGLIGLVLYVTDGKSAPLRADVMYGNSLPGGLWMDNTQVSKLSIFRRLGADHEQDMD